MLESEAVQKIADFLRTRDEALGSVGPEHTPEEREDSARAILALLPVPPPTPNPGDGELDKLIDAAKGWLPLELYMPLAKALAAQQREIERLTPSDPWHWKNRATKAEDALATERARAEELAKERDVWMQSHDRILREKERAWDEDINHAVELKLRRELKARAAKAEAENSALKARVEAAEGAVRFAAEAFRDYERLHRLKGTDEGRDKAERNRALAEAMDNALARTEGEG